MEKITGKTYDGPSGIARDSQWLTSEDLIQGRHVKVKVTHVIRYDKVKFKGGKGPENTKPILLALRFEGKERELGLNRTNTKIMNRMFSSRTGAWVGKSIELYVTQVMAFGEMVDCVRIKDTGSRSATAAEQILHESDSGEPETDAPAETQGDAAEPAADGEGSPLFGGTQPSSAQ